MMTMTMIMTMMPSRLIVRLTRTGLCLRACTREEREEEENGRKGAGRGVVVDGGSRRGKAAEDGTIALVAAQRTKIPPRRLYSNTLGRIIHISGARGQPSTHFRAPATLLAYGRPGKSSLCQIMYTRGQYPHPRPARVCGLEAQPCGTHVSARPAAPIALLVIHPARGLHVLWPTRRNGKLR